MHNLKLLAVAGCAATVLGCMWMGRKLVQLCQAIAAEEADDCLELVERARRRDLTAELEVDH